MNTIEKLRIRVMSELTGSDLTRATDDEIFKKKSDYPGLPDDYIELLKQVGYGRYGEMGFSIYGGPLEPDEIFDPETSKDLKNCIFVGDDYSGWMIGYIKTENGYVFKQFDHQEMMDLKPTNIVDFMYEELFRK